MPDRDKALMLWISEEERNAIDAFCASQSPQPSRSEAMRKLAFHAMAEARAGRVSIEWEGRSEVKARAVRARWQKHEAEVRRKMKEGKR